METRPTGRTQAKAAIERAWLSNGGKQFAYGLGAAYLRDPSQVAVLEHAYARGFRYFDTSLYYGDSELVVGRFLSSVPRESIFLATKTQVIGHRFSEASAADVAAFITDCLQQSLERLGVEQLDLYQLHDLATPDGLAVALEAGRQLQEQGYFRYLGANARDFGVLESAIRLGFDTALTYSDYTPLRQTAGPVLRRGAQGDVAMINATPLASGLLTGSDPRSREWPEWPPSDVARAASLYDLCQTFGLSPRTLALHFPLANPDITITLTGPASVEEVDAGLSSLHEGIAPEVWDAWASWADREREN